MSRQPVVPVQKKQGHRVGRNSAHKLVGPSGDGRPMPAPSREEALGGRAGGRALKLVELFHFRNSKSNATWCFNYLQHVWFCKQKTFRCVSFCWSSCQAAFLHELHMTLGSWVYSSPKRVPITRNPGILSSIGTGVWWELIPLKQRGKWIFSFTYCLFCFKSADLSLARLYQTFPCLGDWNE